MRELLLHRAADYARRAMVLPWEGSITLSQAISRAARPAPVASDVWPELAAPPHPESALRPFHDSRLDQAIANAEYAGWSQGRILLELEIDAGRNPEGRAHG